MNQTNKCIWNYSTVKKKRTLQTKRGEKLIKLVYLSFTICQISWSVATSLKSISVDHMSMDAYLWRRNEKKKQIEKIETQRSGVLTIHIWSYRLWSSRQTINNSTIWRAMYTGFLCSLRNIDDTWFPYFPLLREVKKTQPAAAAAAATKNCLLLGCLQCSVTCKSHSSITWMIPYDPHLPDLNFT